MGGSRGKEGEGEDEFGKHVGCLSFVAGIGGQDTVEDDLIIFSKEGRFSRTVSFIRRVIAQTSSIDPAISRGRWLTKTVRAR
jgi:hypothetical protein